MIKRIILGVLRRLHTLFRPITRRVAVRLRTVTREAVAPLEQQIADLAQQIRAEFADRPPLTKQVYALGVGAKSSEDAILAKIESLDFKLLQLAHAVQAMDQAVHHSANLAANRAAAQSDPATSASTASLSRNLEFIKSRLASFAGDNAVLTYLRDESPIFVNTGDMGCPSPIINGGEWEPENTEILQSFIKASTNFLDIGANVGYYSIIVGNRLAKGTGHVIAFEPHPRMVELIERSVQLNHLEPVVAVRAIAASDRDGVLQLFYPDGHVGQGSSVRRFDTAGQSIEAPARRLDDVLPPGMTFDLVKIDVEGAELAVLRGMEGTIQRSPDIKILFEKLEGPANGEADAVADFFQQLGLDLYGIGPGASLVPLDRPNYTARIGDILAARKGVVEELDRARFSVYPGQLLGQGQEEHQETLYRASAGEMLFFGPYWTLAAGNWTFRVDGTMEGKVRFVIGGDDSALRFDFDLVADALQGSFFLPRDLHQFELRAHAVDDASIRLSRIEFVRSTV